MAYETGLANPRGYVEPRGNLLFHVTNWGVAEVISPSGRILDIVPAPDFGDEFDEVQAGRFVRHMVERHQAAQTNEHGKTNPIYMIYLALFMLLCVLDAVF